MQYEAGWEGAGDALKGIATLDTFSARQRIRIGRWRYHFPLFHRGDSNNALVWRDNIKIKTCSLASCESDVRTLANEHFGTAQPGRSQDDDGPYPQAWAT